MGKPYDISVTKVGDLGVKLCFLGAGEEASGDESCSTSTARVPEIIRNHQATCLSPWH